MHGPGRSVSYGGSGSGRDRNFLECMHEESYWIYLARIGDRLDPTEIDRSGWGERINLQVDMPGLFCTHQGIQYEIDKIIGRYYLKFYNLYDY